MFDPTRHAQNKLPSQTYCCHANWHARNPTEKYTHGEGTTLDMKMKEQCNIKQNKTNLT